MRKLKLSKDTWDYENFFMLEGVRNAVQLMQDYHKKGDGIYWGLNAGSMLKAEYTQEDIKHRERMKAYEPIKQGELVEIENDGVFKIKILGNYSDCAIFEKVK